MSWGSKVRDVRVFLCVALLAVTACERAGNTAPDTPSFRVQDGLVGIAAEGPVTFRVAEAKRGPALPLPRVTARVTTVETLTSPSYAPLAGRIVEARVRLGDHATKGQPLVLIRSADLPGLERELRSAELAVDTRAASLQRTRALVASRAGSQHDLALAQSELAEAEFARRAAKARFKSLQIARDRDDTTYWVLATRSGTVVQLEATPGAQINADRPLPVATVADLAALLVVADLPQRDAVALERGTRALIYPFGSAGEAVEGEVELVSEVVDPERQTVPVRVRVDNRARKLRPNAYVDVSFAPDQARSTVLLPAVAVVRDGATAVVFVQSERGRFVRRAVVVGRRTRGEVEILSGVEPGERVVTSGALLLVNALDVEA